MLSIAGAVTHSGIYLIKMTSDLGTSDEILKSIDAVCAEFPSSDLGMERLMKTLIIEGLHRDVLKKRSFVTVTWKDEPEKRLGLPVPFDCQLDALKTETEKAVRALAKELESATIQGP